MTTNFPNLSIPFTAQLILSYSLLRLVQPLIYASASAYPLTYRLAVPVLEAVAVAVAIVAAAVISASIVATSSAAGSGSGSDGMVTRLGRLDAGAPRGSG